MVGNTDYHVLFSRRESHVKMTFYCDYRYLLIIIVIFCLISVFHPDRHAKHYAYISSKDVFKELVQTSHTDKSNLKLCKYEEVILNNREIKIDILKKHHDLPYSGTLNRSKQVY